MGSELSRSRLMRKSGAGRGPYMWVHARRPEDRPFLGHGSQGNRDLRQYSACTQKVRRMVAGRDGARTQIHWQTLPRPALGKKVVGDRFIHGLPSLCAQRACLTMTRQRAFFPAFRGTRGMDPTRLSCRLLPAGSSLSMVKGALTPKVTSSVKQSKSRHALHWRTVALSLLLPAVHLGAFSS